jgi:Methylase involved in ubiquinone/menaquinone biosynthesis
MLDIGIGGGRTTHYFSDLVDEYIGIDYSSGMVEACKKKFDKRMEVCDVRDLGRFEDSYFDFVMFSFNGLDTLSHEDRLKSLKEIRRVLKDNGFLFFSSHNYQIIERFYSLKLSLNPTALRNNYNALIIRLKNKPYAQLKKQTYCTLKSLTLENYYIVPGEQIRQLETAGFRDIRVFSLNDGCEIKGDPDKSDDLWLHYLCQKSSSLRPDRQEDAGSLANQRLTVPPLRST